MQHLAEALERPLGQRGVSPHEPESGVEGVQQEVGIELAAERRQLRPGAQCFGLGRARGLFPHPLGVLPRVCRAGNREIDEPADERLPGGDHRRRGKLGAASGEKRIERPGRDHPGRRGHGIRRHQRELSREERGPPLVAPGHAPGNPQYQKAEERKRKDGQQGGPDRGHGWPSSAHVERRVHRDQGNPGDHVRAQRRMASHAKMLLLHGSGMPSVRRPVRPLDRLVRPLGDLRRHTPDLTLKL
jgi:hypothetical protein